jgi:hypothetical protein
VHACFSQLEDLFVLLEGLLFESFDFLAAEANFLTHIIGVEGPTSFFDAVIESLYQKDNTFLVVLEECPAHSDCNLRELLLE